MNTFGKLKNAPLTVVLVEVSFGFIKDIETYIGKLQDIYRKNHYPEYATAEMQNLHVSNNQIRIEGLTTWQFFTADKTKGFDINANHIVFYSLKYERFPSFLDDFIKILEIFIKIVEPAILPKIGLRYSNLIKPIDGEDVLSYIDSNFAYIPKLLDEVDSLQCRVENHIIKDPYKAIIRSIYGDFDINYSPDLLANPLVAPNFKDTEQTTRLLFDIDVYSEQESRDFQIDFIVESLIHLNKFAKEIFGIITTEKARSEIWQ